MITRILGCYFDGRCSDLLSIPKSKTENEIKSKTETETKFETRNRNVFVIPNDNYNYIYIPNFELIRQKGEPGRTRDFLPVDKQYLVTRNGEPTSLYLHTFPTIWV
jgi:hypothetical protein